MSNFTETHTKTKEVEILTVQTPVPQPEKKKRDYYPYLLCLSLVVALCFGVFLGAMLRPEAPTEKPSAENAAATNAESGFPEWITEAYLTLDGESRTGERLDDVLNIAVHYVANPGSSAMANRNYFEGPDSDTSSHFIVGLEGEVLLLIPLDERSCATNERNVDTISVEVCHPDETGEFSPETYDSLVRLLAYLCDRFGLVEEELIRHYDVTGKMCPRYYVEHPEAWEQLKSDVKDALEKGDFHDVAA